MSTLHNIASEMVTSRYPLTFPGKLYAYLILLFLLPDIGISANLKFIIEDFEGLAEGQNKFNKEGIFTFGAITATAGSKGTTGHGFSGSRLITLNRTGNEHFAGVGKGLSRNIELDTAKDFLCFYLHFEKETTLDKQLKINLEEDDNADQYFDSRYDDRWGSYIQGKYAPGWHIINIPLSMFNDENIGGDRALNIGYKTGKLFTIMISTREVSDDLFPLKIDFLVFSDGPLQASTSFEPRVDDPSGFCLLGAWSEEGNKAMFEAIATNFESSFKKDSDKKIGVVHFFQPFSGENKRELFPSVTKINSIISSGYVPMITLENHFAKPAPGEKQPDLYSIIGGYFDEFLTTWATEVGKVDGVVLLRILHEFNGDWYPWCIANNTQNPELYKQAFIHIRKIFDKAGVKNVRFVWCPNSMSIPQAPWNFILDAYPGDQYVDFVGMDVYNGAGDKSKEIWRSFRAEATENYYILSQKFPSKQLLICETSSRERTQAEPANAQQKAEWIYQMSEALKTDMSRVRLLTWFNEYDYFKVNSSEESRKSYLRHIIFDDYYKNGHSSFFN